jgi:hypothetical protein
MSAFSVVNRSVWMSHGIAKLKRTYLFRDYIFRDYRDGSINKNVINDIIIFIIAHIVNREDHRKGVSICVL